MSPTRDITGEDKTSIDAGPLLPEAPDYLFRLHHAVLEVLCWAKHANPPIRDVQTLHALGALDEAMVAMPEPTWVDGSPVHMAMIRRDNTRLRAQVIELSTRLARITGSGSPDAIAASAAGT